MDNKQSRISDDPRKLPFKMIKDITNNFSEELGRGAFGRVFKGAFEDGEEIAVKVLNFMPGISDQQFQNEFENLKRLNHPNIVRLVGFCDEVEQEIAEYNGKLVSCDRIHRALCLEYMPKGSLGKLLSGEYLGKNWPIRYRIIKGICEGLKYLREGLEVPIFHFDLKPDNILLDDKMVPKIADFGLSRLIGDGNTIKTMTPLGTVGYLPPEFINNQVISKEYDIYSLGVIITQIMIGITGYSDVADMGAQEFIEHVHDIWKRTLQEIPMYESLEADCRQVKICIAIAINCMEKERRRRPTIKDIVHKFNEMGTTETVLQLPVEECHEGESIVIPSRPYKAQIAGAILTAVAKIDSIIEDEAAKAIIYKLSAKVPYLNKLPWRIREIGRQLKLLSNLIRQIGIVYRTDEIVKSWIGDVRRKLMQLRSIWIDNVSAADCPNLFATLSAMPLLSSLLISARDVDETLCLQALDPISTKLHRLIVRALASGTLKYPIFRNHGEHLKYLALSSCQLGEDPLGVLAPHVPNLTYLSLNKVKSASTLVLSAGCFPHLKTLVLKRMPDVTQMEIGDGALPRIEGIYILSLAQLDKIPQGIELLLSLKKLWLLYLHVEFKTLWQTSGMHQKMQHVPEIRMLV